MVTSTAQRFLLALTTFSPTSIDRAFSRVQGYATGPFSSQAATFFNSSIRQELESAQASSQGQIRDLFVQRLNGDSASLFAVVDQTYTNDKVSAPIADVLRLVVDMKKRPAGWRVSQLTVLQAPNAASGP